jgi:hypothetical protein
MVQSDSRIDASISRSHTKRAMVMLNVPLPLTVPFWDESEMISELTVRAWSSTEAPVSRRLLVGCTTAAKPEQSLLFRSKRRSAPLAVSVMNVLPDGTLVTIQG